MVPAIRAEKHPETAFFVAKKSLFTKTQLHIRTAIKDAPELSGDFKTSS